MSTEVIAGKSPWGATAKEYYLEKDGKLYCEETNKGYPYGNGNVEIEITNQSDNKIDCIATMELIDMSNNKTYDKVNITLELKDNNWIITSYKKQIKVKVYINLNFLLVVICKNKLIINNKYIIYTYI